MECLECLESSSQVGDTDNVLELQYFSIAGRLRFIVVNFIVSTLSLTRSSGLDRLEPDQFHILNFYKLNFNFNGNDRQ